MLDNLSKDLEKLFLVGIGAAAITAEKSKELIEELVKKGSLSVEEGKKLNEELKHHRQEKKVDSLKEDVKNLSSEDLEELKKTIKEMEKGK